MANSRVGRKNRASPATAGDAELPPILKRVQQLLSEISELRAANSRLEEELDQLRGYLRQIDEALQGLPHSTRPRRGAERRAAQRSAATQTLRRQPVKITDPIVLERRRAALTKARKALAEKRAARREAGG